MPGTATTLSTMSIGSRTSWTRQRMRTSRWPRSRQRNRRARPHPTRPMYLQRKLLRVRKRLALTLGKGRTLAMVAKERVGVRRTASVPETVISAAKPDTTLMSARPWMPKRLQQQPVKLRKLHNSPPVYTTALTFPHTHTHAPILHVWLIPLAGLKHVIILLLVLIHVTYIHD